MPRRPSWPSPSGSFTFMLQSGCAARSALRRAASSRVARVGAITVSGCARKSAGAKSSCRGLRRPSRTDASESHPRFEVLMSDVIGLRPGSMLGEAAKPPFAVLPDPAAPFINRSMRLTTLAPAHDLAPYLSFLATLTRAQHDIQQDLALAAPPPFDRIGQSLDHGMAPLAKAQLGPDPAIELTLERCLDRLADADA